MNPTTIIWLMLVLSTAATKSDQQFQQQTEVLAPTVQPWQLIGNFNGPRSAHASILINNKIYIFGGVVMNVAEEMRYDDVQYFEVNSVDGKMIPGSLVTTQSFSTARSDFAVAYYNGYVYLVGGFSGSNELDDVQYGRVENDGSILEWTISSSHLNSGRSHHQLEIIKTLSGKIYLAAIAGSTTTTDDLRLSLSDTVEIAEINADGSIGEWQICLSHIKGGRQYPTTNIVDNYLYVIGGRGDVFTQEIFNDVQFASIQDDGCPSSWSTSAHNLKIPLYEHTSLVLQSNLFIVLGGSGGDGNYFNNVQYSSLHTDDADTKSWALNNNPFAIPRSGHTSVQLKDKFVYVIGGRSGQQTADLNDIQMAAVYLTDTSSKTKNKRKSRKVLNNKY